MLTSKQFETLQEIESAVAFDDGGRATELVIEGYVEKNGDFFSLRRRVKKLYWTAALR